MFYHHGASLNKQHTVDFIALQTFMYIAFVTESIAVYVIV